MILQHVLIFSVSKCVNKNAWNIKSRTDSETFCHYCAKGVSRAVIKGEVYGFKLPPNIFGKIALQKKTMQRDLRMLSVDALWSMARSF